MNQSSPHHYGPTVVSTVVTIGFVLVLAMLILRPVQLTADIADIVKILSGTLSTMFAAVVQYHIGSSLGSKSKDAIIAGMANGPDPAAPVTPPKA